jgi:ribosomal protein L19
MFNKAIIKFSLLNSVKRHVSKLSQQKESIFDNNFYNPFHISPLRNKKRKGVPALQELEPKINYIPPAMKENRKEIIQKLEKEEIDKIRSNGTFKKEPVKLGDTIEVEYFHSITSQKIYKYKGVVLGTYKEKTIKSAFKFLTIIGGEYTFLIYPFYSPMINSIKVIKKGNKDPHMRKIFYYKKVNSMGIRLKEMLKGGKSINVNKAKKMKLQKEDRDKDSIIIE